MGGLWIRLRLFLLVALGTAAALRCYSCEDEEAAACPQLDCAPGQDRCRATALASLWPVTRTTQWVRTSRGCDVAGKPNNSLSFASTAGSVLFLSEHFCASELCNREDPRGPDLPHPRGTPLRCLSCAASEGSCPGRDRAPLPCADPRDQCVDIATLGGPHDAPDERRLKGCGRVGGCGAPLGFHNARSLFLLRCCNRSLCNDDPHDVEVALLPPNSVTCYSCEGNRTHGCAPHALAELRCRGPMTRCLEAEGTHEVEGPGWRVRGCASPAWCDSPYTAIYKRLQGARAHCCHGSRALMCHRASSVLFYGPRDHVLDAIVTPKTNQSCPPDTPACLTTSATLRTGAMWVTATFWGCSERVTGTMLPPRTTLPPGATPLQHHVQLCHSDLCNHDLYEDPVPLDDPMSLWSNEGPAPHDATQCLSGLSSKPEPGILERVTCPGEAQCYHSSGTIVAGELSVPLFVWSCQPWPCAAAPVRHHLGPLLITQEGACCNGSFCTGTMATQERRNESHVVKEVAGPKGTPTLFSASLAPKVGEGNPGLVTTATPGFHPVTQERDRKGNPGWVTLAPLGATDSKGLYKRPEDGGPPHKGVTQTSTYPFPSTRPARHPMDPGKQQQSPTKGPQAGGAPPGLPFCPLLLALGIAHLVL